MYDYGFRYYTPWLQRWINPDPAGDVDGFNLFCMVRNNPVSYIDTDGRMLRSTSQIISNDKNEFETPIQERSSNVLNFPSLAQPSVAEEGAVGESESRRVDFFRLDLAPPCEILAQGFWWRYNGYLSDRGLMLRQGTANNATGQQYLLNRPGFRRHLFALN